MNKDHKNLAHITQLKNIALISRKIVSGLMAGNYRSVFKGPGLEFDEAREYFEGDDARFIDWNVSARMNAPYVKTFREEREMVLFLVQDFSASLFSGTGLVNKRDTAGLIASILSYAAVLNNDQVGAIFFSEIIEKWVSPMKGQKHVTRLISDLLNYQPQGKGSDLGLALGTVYQSLKRRGICIIISDFKTESGWKEMSMLARKHDVIAIKITDPAEKVFPVTGLTELEDSETGHSVYGIGISKRFQRKYHDFWETQELHWKRECRRRGIHTLILNTDDDPVQNLVAFFSRRKKGR